MTAKTTHGSPEEVTLQMEKWGRWRRKKLFHVKMGPRKPISDSNDKLV